MPAYGEPRGLDQDVLRGRSPSDGIRVIQRGRGEVTDRVDPTLGRRPRVVGVGGARPRR